MMGSDRSKGLGGCVTLIVILLTVSNVVPISQLVECGLVILPSFTTSQTSLANIRRAKEHLHVQCDSAFSECCEIACCNLTPTFHHDALGGVSFNLCLAVVRAMKCMACRY